MTDIAKYRLEQGTKYPYDAASNSLPPADWSRVAALGVLADLQDRRGIKWELEKVDSEVRVELVQSMAEIIRAAAQKQKAS